MRVPPLLAKVTFWRGLSGMVVIHQSRARVAAPVQNAAVQNVRFIMLAAANSMYSHICAAPLQGQVRLVDRDAHAAQPGVALERADLEGGVPHPQPRVAALVRIGLRAAPVLLQEHPQALLGRAEVLLGIERAQHRVVGDLFVEAGTMPANVRCPPTAS